VAVQNHNGVEVFAGLKADGEGAAATRRALH
jgi:hypothetical protein